MNRHDLALIGFGGVNRALADLIRTRGDELAEELGFALRVVAITDLRLGSLVRDEGIDLDAVFALGADDTFAAWPGGAADPRNAEVIRETSADIVVEATFTNPLDGEPGVSHVRLALEAGKSVTTTNKGPVALAGTELNAVAAAHGVHFAYEGSVVSGTPVLRFAASTLQGLRIDAVRGILNGTSNYVLGQMEAGMDLATAVAEAQTLGYAEADPSADIEGSDVRLKVVILANEVLGARITPADVTCTGITGLAPADIADAAARGLRFKLIGSAERRADGSIDARVEPMALPLTHPLAGISGPTNAVSFDTDLLGTVTVSGPGAGRVETAYALLSDIIEIDARVARTAEAKR